MKTDGSKIMVVDDYEGILIPIDIALTSEGYQVITIKDPHIVVEQAIQHKPDLVLMDILMLGFDGRDIVKELKKVKETKDICIVLMSASPKLKTLSIDAGADDFIEKPFDIDQLLNKIKKNICLNTGYK